MEVIGWMAFFIALYVAYKLEKLIRELKRRGILEQEYK